MISTGADPILIKVTDSQGQNLAPSTVYTKFQPLQRHAYPMFYELNFEAICRFPASGSAFGLELLYNDHTVRDNTFYRNDGSSVGSERSWWLNPLPSSHHFIKSGIIELFSRFETLETNLLASSYHDLDEEHTAWLKNTKMKGPIVERFQELYDHVICA
ncbi:unnamed protein product [Rotaria socialis]|uniref:Uncharacterized protein n=1 Tax=Rotaria socialis TaxID=392032 RepID=A0A820Z2X2_9BILA|nr:unnamed protein product [Rotaria socialis]